MLLSMTGFGSKSAMLDLPESGKVAFSIELKAINARFFEAGCKLPNALSSLEVKIINLLQKKLIRGRVYLTIRFTEDNEAFEDVVPSLKHIKSYLAAANTIKETCKVSGDLTLANIFQLPDVFIASKNIFTQKEEDAILAMVEQVADLMTKTRLEEGKSLQKDLVKIFFTCGEKMEEIRKLSEKLMESLKQHVDQHLVLVEKGDELAKLKLQDFYAMVNKADIHEEITRFKSHLASVDALLKSKEIDKGKRLDFILQELLRETNTIMSKCSDFDISSLGVDVKVELEKAREQVQNIV